MVTPGQISIVSWIVLIVSLGLVLVPGCGSSGPVRHSISGQVFVDGVPAERVLVQLIRQSDGSDAGLGNDSYPSGYTDSNGQFTIGKDLPSPGAVEGRYRVVFSWLSSGDLDAFDKLRGRYADVNTTKETLTVPSDGLGSLKYELISSPNK